MTKNTITFRFHNGITVTVPTETDKPLNPEYIIEAAQELAIETMDSLGAWSDCDIDIKGETA